MRIRTFRTVQGETNKFVVVDWRSMPGTKNSEQKKSSHKVNRQADHSRKSKRGGIPYNEEESE